MYVKDSTAEGRESFNIIELILSGPIAFLVFSLLIYAPTSCTAIGGILNESLELILSLQNVFRDGWDLIVIRSASICRVKHGVS